jgi:hypothetical protein
LNSERTQVNGLDLAKVGYVKAQYWFYKLIFNKTNIIGSLEHTAKNNVLNNAMSDVLLKNKELSVEFEKQVDVSLNKLVEAAQNEAMTEGTGTVEKPQIILGNIVVNKIKDRIKDRKVKKALKKLLKK